MAAFYLNCADERLQFWWQHFVFMGTGVWMALCSNYLGNSGLDDAFSGLLLLPNYAGQVLAFPYLFVPHDGPRWEWRFALISTLDLAGNFLNMASIILAGGQLYMLSYSSITLLNAVVKYILLGKNQSCAQWASLGLITVGLMVSGAAAQSLGDEVFLGVVCG